MFQRKDPAQLAAQLAAMKPGSSFTEDGKEWKPTLDNAGNGSAVIRFLPGKDADASPFITLINHGFKLDGQNKWYIENCTSTHGDFDSCPVCQYISDNDLFKSNNPLYQKLKRKTSFWSNILVIKDPGNPENEGKVFKYRFGQKVMDKINAEINVDTAIGEVPVDVTCAFAGKNFVLKIKKVSGFSNYDECKFQGQTEIANINDAAFQKKLTEDMFDLSTMITPDQFNDFEKNNEAFKRAMGTAVMGGAAAEASKQADAIEDELAGFAQEMETFETKPADNQAATNLDAEQDQDLDAMLAEMEN